MRFISFPVTDMGLPKSAGAFAELASRLHRDLEAGIDTLIHCRAGIGRSGLLAAAVLVQGGTNAREAFARVARARGLRKQLR